MTRVAVVLTCLVLSLALPLARAADVVVLGSEPEAIAAAVAAAESGASVRLVTPDERLGGLFTLGALNVLDLRTRPFSFQRGLFDRWWARVGARAAFDPLEAERAFAALLDEAGVEVVLGARDVVIESADGRVRGVSWDGGHERALQVIDGDADLTYARAAGAEASFGWRSFGLDARMADTLVFRIDGLDWSTLRRAADARGRGWATVDEAVAWGHFGGVPAAFPSSDPNLRLRGLNLGRDASGGVWVNALLIFGVDPFDPASRADARARATAEAERIVAFLVPRLPGFERARLGAVAERLYVRETVHLDAACVLDADHLLSNTTGVFDIAAGGYPLDLQSLTPADSGFVFGAPEVYGVPLCVAVPTSGPDGVWTVGRSIGYDPVAHASTRVVPLGMAVAEAVGIAAAAAARQHAPLLALVEDAAFVGAVRDTLRARDAYLPDVRERPGVGPVDHPHYEAFRRMVARGLAVGGYANAPDLDAPASARSHVYLAAEVATRFAYRRDVAVALVAAYAGVDGAAETNRIAVVQRAAACRLQLPCPDGDDPTALRRAGLWPDDVPTSGTLTRGEVYALGAVLATAPTSDPR